MEQVRSAVTELREGKVVQALERLDADGRILEAESGEEAYEALVDAWYSERQRRLADPSRQRSAVTAEHHFERRELNRRARERLAADGTLHGPELLIGALSFRAGDEVVARVTDRGLRAPGASHGAYVRNGSLGTVTEVVADSLVVEFERWGRVRVPRSYLEQEVVPGIAGGLELAYALTSYGAQGETFSMASPLITDASSREGVYVGLTRAKHELQAVAVRRRDVRRRAVDDDLPALEDQTGALEATERSIRTERGARFALEYNQLADAAAEESDRQAGTQRRCRRLTDPPEVALPEPEDSYRPVSASGPVMHA